MCKHWEGLYFFDREIVFPRYIFAVDVFHNGVIRINDNPRLSYKILVQIFDIQVFNTYI